VPEFVKVGSLSQFSPGVVYEGEISGKRVILVNLEGTLHAVSNTCPHVSLPLTGGSVSGDTIVCPFHGSAFTLATGECVEGPAQGDSLESYEVRVEGEDVLVEAP
jgi:nitrite reductase/ring-hydroxylating ferredoxin subunit